MVSLPNHSGKYDVYPSTSSDYASLHTGQVRVSGNGIFVHFYPVYTVFSCASFRNFFIFDRILDYYYHFTSQPAFPLSNWTKAYFYWLSEGFKTDLTIGCAGYIIGVKTKEVRGRLTTS
jgi:hypothetical protein